MVSNRNGIAGRRGWHRPAKRRGCACPWRTLRYEPLESRQLLSVYYVDAVNGNDSWTGLSGSYTSGNTGPWQTITKVNSATFLPGDSILFQRGETWRGQMFVRSGNSSNSITYGAYGDTSLPKPQILGSNDQSLTSEWTYTGNNIWSTIPVANQMTATGNELLPNPSFDSDVSHWTFSKAGTAQATGARTTTNGEYDSSPTAPAGYKINCTTNDGSASTDIQLYTQSLSITSGNYYLLTFEAKATSQFTLAGIDLKKSTSPYTSYGAIYSYLPTITADGQFHQYKVLFLATATATNARLTFYLGGAVPTNSTFFIDTLSFKVCQSNPTVQRLIGQSDVGNLIFNNGSDLVDFPCGVKRYVLTDGTTPLGTYNTGLHNQGDFYYDGTDCTVKLHSTSNPASYYNHIELALNNATISAASASFLTIQDLDLRIQREGRRERVHVGFNSA